MKIMKIGIATYEDMKERTKAIARGTVHRKPDEPKVWFTSLESVAKVLSDGNRELLQVIAERHPSSLDELAKLTGRKKSNLSRTLKTMAGYGIVELAKGEKGRVAAKVLPESIRLDLPLRKAAV